MVLLIGNYSPDQQQSMQRFNAMMLQGLSAAGIPAEMIKPESIFGRSSSTSSFVAKWLAYVDKYILFPFQLRKRLAKRPALVHIGDHSNAVYVSRCRGLPVIVTCHDLLAVRGGLGEETDCPASATGKLLQRWILRGLRKADVVACVSEATARDAERMVRRGNLLPRVALVPNGLNFAYGKLPIETARARLARVSGLDSGRPFVLHVGSNLRRKNRDGVLRIFAQAADRWDGQLVFAGELLTEELASLAKGLGIFERVVQIENADNETLEALYNCALALLYPSRFEGFGWPIIEAHACGCPVLCSRAEPLPEVAGEAGLYRELEDEAGFAADLVRLIDPSERAKWSEKSLHNATRFSTDRMIRQYIDLYRSLGAKL